MKYTADFETTVDINDCRVWATGICSIDNKHDFYYGNSIDWLFDFFRLHNGDTFYFHNLKFDGEFIINYLFKHGYRYVHDKRELDYKTFNCLMSDSGLFYGLWIMIDEDCKINILDSMKIIPFSVEIVAQTFGLPISKLEIDYAEYRKPGHDLTPVEIDYLKNDVTIMAMALKTLFAQKLNKMTQGSNALHDYKKIVGGKMFERWFPYTFA